MGHGPLVRLGHGCLWFIDVYRHASLFFNPKNGISPFFIDWRPFPNDGIYTIQFLTRVSHELRGPWWHSPGLWWRGQCIWNYGDWISWRSREDQGQQSERPKSWYTIRTCIMHMIVVSQNLTQREVGIKTEQEGWGIARRDQIFKCQSRQPPFFLGGVKHP